MQLKTTGISEKLRLFAVVISCVEIRHAVCCLADIKHFDDLSRVGRIRIFLRTGWILCGRSTRLSAANESKSGISTIISVPEHM